MRRGRLAAALLAVACALPAAAEELDLERAVELALARNPALKAVEERRSQVRGGVLEARAEALPQVSLVTTWNRSRNPSLLNSPDFEDFIAAFPGNFTPREQELYGLSVELKQPIYTFGKLGAAIDLARLAVDVVEAQVSTTQLEGALLAAEAFYRLREAKERLTTVEAQRRTREESLAVVQARFELGDATRLEQLQAQASLAQLGPVVDQAAGDVDTARLRLASLLDLPVASEVDVVSTDAPIAPLPAADRALAEALRRRPEFADLERQAEALAKQRQVKMAEGRPQIELDGFYGRTVRLLDNLGDPLFADWRVGINLRWKMYDGGRKHGQVIQIDSQREQLRWQLEDLRNRVELEVEQAISEYRTALSRLTAAEAAADVAREASHVARQSYEEGVALQADWLDAQQREILAEVERVGSRFDAQLKAARLARAMGLRADRSWSDLPATGAVE